MRKAVLDSTVLVSAFLNNTGVSYELLRLASAGAFALCLAEDILNEVEKVLGYPRIRKKRRYTDEDISTYVDRVPSVIRRSEPRMPRFDRSFQRKQRHDKCRPNWLSILSRDDERPRWLTKKISPAPLRLKSST